MKKDKVIFLVILLIFILVYIYIQGRSPELSIHFINVGEGDSIFIKTFKNEAILIDAGNLLSGFKVCEYLRKNNIRILDRLILTHYDLDHIGGAFFVLQMFKVRHIYDNGQNLGSLTNQFDIYRWYETLVRKNENYSALKAKDVISLDNVILEVIWPSHPLLPSGVNDNSLVIKLKSGGFSCLFTADITEMAEKEVLRIKPDLRSDVLKVSHHGAIDASSKEFIKAVSPKIAIISVDTGNIRGYPSKQVINRLEKENITIYRTDIDKDVVIKIYKDKINGYNYNIKTNKRAKAAGGAAVGFAGYPETLTSNTITIKVVEKK